MLEMTSLGKQYKAFVELETTIDIQSYRTDKGNTCFPHTKTSSFWMGLQTQTV